MLSIQDFLYEQDMKRAIQSIEQANQNNQIPKIPGILDMIKNMWNEGPAKVEQFFEYLVRSGVKLSKRTIDWIFSKNEGKTSQQELRKLRSRVEELNNENQDLRRHPSFLPKVNVPDWYWDVGKGAAGLAATAALGYGAYRATKGILNHKARPVESLSNRVNPNTHGKLEISPLKNKSNLNVNPNHQTHINRAFNNPSMRNNYSNKWNKR